MQPSKVSGYFFILILASPVLHAAVPDKATTPIHITSDSLTMEGKKRISVYRGNVEISQANTLLKGNKVTVYTDENHKIIKILAQEQGNKRAYYQERDKNNVFLKAWGKEILYRVEKQQIELQGKAKLTQNGNVFTGHSLEYNQKTEQVRINANQTSPEKDRVKISIQPDNN